MATATSIVSVKIDGKEVSGTPAEIANILQTINAPIAKKTRKKTQKVETFEEFLIQQITPHFGKELSEQMIEALTEIRQNQPDFRKFRRFYRKVETLELRQLLKVLSAVYRIKYAQFLNDGYLSSLISTIKYATSCSHCGAVAKAFFLRLEQEGFLN
jgi:GTP1/Obg family GTP-binding protein